MSDLSKSVMPPTIVILHGDQTGEELLQQAMRVLDPGLLGFEMRFENYDLSLENRRATQNDIVRQAALAMRKSGLGFKAATITPENPNDVGSPNALLREAINGRVILRIGRRLPKVPSVAGVHAPIAIVRMAVDDAYNAREWREKEPNGDEIALRTSCISRNTCRSVAEFSFQLAQRMKAPVFGGPKYTVSPVYEGMFKEELDAAAARHPEVKYQPMLIDTTFALLMKTGGESLVIPALNRDGDLLSDLVLQMFGTLAGSESLVLTFVDNSSEVEIVMAEAPHGTAPALQGKNIANPVAMILAAAGLLSYIKSPDADQASRAIYEAVYESIYEGDATVDLGGHLTTSEFTEEIMRRTSEKLEVWENLGK